MISQANISPSTPMGANLVSGGGATFRAWAPLASAVYINGTFASTPTTGQTANLLLVKDANGLRFVRIDNRKFIPPFVIHFNALAEFGVHVASASPCQLL